MAKKILFTSGKGGVGKSTVSSTLARLLCEEEKSVLIIDFDVSLRTLDIMFFVGSVVLYDWYDVLAGNCEPESALLKTIGPQLLAAPVSEVEVTEKDMEKLISFYDEKFDYILLDCPAGVGNILSATLSVSDLAIVISTPDLVCVRSAAVAADMASKAGVESRLIINRVKKNIIKNGRALNIDDVIDATGVQLIGVIPDDLQLSLSVLNGESVDPSSKSVKALKRIMHRIMGESIPLKI